MDLNVSLDERIIEAVNSLQDDCIEQADCGRVAELPAPDTDFIYIRGNHL